MPDGTAPAADPLATDGGLASGAGDAGLPGTMDPVVRQLDVARVWSGHPVKFDLVTHGDLQFVAFYDAERVLTVGQRKLHEDAFELVRLPSTLGWDSHNDVVIALDGADKLHVAGNMHSSPLVYFRSTRPLDVHSLAQQSRMVGRDEQACTYPQFFRSPTGDLVFMYRSGQSGNGNHIFNAFDAQAGTWRRLHDSPLTDGQGSRNAYPVGPIQGPDGWFHLVWVWRDTPDAATNHSLSYARSRDLTAWEAADGSPIALPITLTRGDIVDPVPPGAGMINNNTKVGFDGQGRPIVSYHKHDAGGATQLYNARFEQGRWVVYQTTRWSSRWNFGGGGTLVFEIVVEPVELATDGTLIQRYYNANEGGHGAFRLDPDTLAAEEDIAPPTHYPKELARVESTTRGMEVRWQADRTPETVDGITYMLRWETLPSNRDQPRAVVPDPTPLRLYGFPQVP